MDRFIVKELVTDNLELELEKIGFDSVYRKAASDKYKYKNLKIFNLNPAQANILKQTALTVGADCATHREVITGKVEVSNVILGGSFSQLRKIADKLKHQPFSLGVLGNSIIESIASEKRKTKLAGIINITPDSFSDGGKYFDPEDAYVHAMELIEDGADMIDIGAESTRPFSEGVAPDVQIERLKPLLIKLKDINIPVSIDTRSSEVARFTLDSGAAIITDVYGYDYDPNMVNVVSEYKAGIILQHSQGIPENMQVNPVYDDAVEEIYMSLKKKIDIALANNIENIIVDVGIGFGKTKEDNFELLNRIEEFYSLACPVMVGVSRKSLLGLSNNNDSMVKDSLSAAISYPLMQKGVDYLRVHNVKLHKQLLNLVY